MAKFRLVCVYVYVNESLCSTPELTQCCKTIKKYFNYVKRRAGSAYVKSQKKKTKQKTWRPRCCPPERISPLSFLGPHHFPVLGEARCGQVAQQLRPRSFSCSKIAQSPLLSQPSFATRQDPGNILTTS